SSAFSVSNLLTGWLSYVRTGYRDSLNNESHFLCIHDRHLTRIKLLSLRYSQLQESRGAGEKLQ
ncbi:MAG: hypothetical protein V7L10_29280, partial [Nostoc sp.]